MVKMTTDMGNINVSADVFTNLAGAAATNCFGVRGMAMRSVSDGLVHLLKREAMGKGVHITFNEDNTIAIELHIVVKNGETVVYDGAYSCINDGAGIDLNTELAPNSTVAFSIQLRCDFEYAGSGLAEEDMINWLFYAVVTQDEEPVKERFSDSALYEVILACGAALIVLTGIVVYDRFWKQRHN